jgi:hypothetical protein
MKHHRILLIAIGLLIAAQVSVSQEKKFGLGLMFGEPTGLSAKYWNSASTAFDFGLGFGLAGGENDFHMHADYVWHSFSAIGSTERFPVYYGLGGSVGGGHGSTLAARGVLGIAWMSRESPIDIFLEFVPAWQLAPSMDIILQGGVGIRYFFQ